MDYTVSCEKSSGTVFNEFKWADAELYKPQTYILVLISTGKKIMVGWWTGNEWFSTKLKEKDKIIKWKVKKTNDYH